jgi:hypothetical protein
VWLTDKEKDPDDDEMMSSDDPKPVEFEGGKPNFALEYFPR